MAHADGAVQTFEVDYGDLGRWRFRIEGGRRPPLEGVEEFVGSPTGEWFKGLGLLPVAAEAVDRVLHRSDYASVLITISNIASSSGWLAPAVEHRAEDLPAARTFLSEVLAQLAEGRPPSVRR